MDELYNATDETFDRFVTVPGIGYIWTIMAAGL